MLHCLFFQDLKGHKFFDACAIFFLSEFYLSLLFKFKIGLLLGLSCLMSSKVIIMRPIIRTIKATWIDNTILMVELEVKLP